MTAPARADRTSPAAAVSGPLLRYRVLAIATGITLATMTFVGIPLQIAGKADTAVGIGWTIHGWLYVVYLVVVANLGLRLRWSIGRLVLVALAGTVPLCSFIAERKVTRRVREQQAEAAPTAG